MQEFPYGLFLLLCCQIVEVYVFTDNVMNIGPADGYQSFVHELFNNIVGMTIFPGEPATEFYHTNVDNDGTEELDTWGTMMRANVAHDNFDAAYILGYRESEMLSDADRDMSTLSLLNEMHHEESEWGSFEARFTSNPDGAWSMKGDLEWTFGLYYFMEEGEKQLDLYNYDTVALATGGFADGLASLQFFQEINTEAFAVFGQSTYSLNNTTRLTTGLRWTQEEKTAGTATNVIDPFGGAIFGPPNNGGIINEIYDTEATEKWDDITLKLGLEYDVSEDTLFYAQYSEGFKSGGFNGTSASRNLAETAFDPEDVESIELGLKSNINNRLRANLALYSMDYKNLQTAVISDGGTPFILNANADIQGAEFELVGIPTENLTLSLSVGFIDSEYVKSEGSPELEGTQVNGVPEWKYSMAADYQIVLSSGNIDLHADYSWEDDTTSTSSAGRTSPRLEDWQVGNVSASFTPNSGQWELSSWVRNVADTEYWLSIGSAIASTSPADSMVRLAAPPRTYGLTITYFLQ